MTKILVTGGLGYIGSHTVVELQQNGYEVVIIDNLSNATIEVLERISKITKIKPHFIKGDLQDINQINSLFSIHTDIAGVIHFAALKSVSESMEKPIAYYKNNLDSLINLLDAMATYKVQNLIFSSSCTVYGQADTLPIAESAPLKKAASPYGKTKKISEDIIEDVSKSSTLKAIALRYFNPIGAHTSAEIGELPVGVPQNLVPYVTQTAAGIREQLLVFGGDYPTQDGTAIRDYIHVVDLAQAHVVALKRLQKQQQEKPFEIFNIGAGKGYSVLELIKTFEKVTGQILNYKIVDRRDGDVVTAYAETSRANDILGWKANLTLEDALMSAWSWQQRLMNT